MIKKLLKRVLGILAILSIALGFAACASGESTSEEKPYSISENVDLTGSVTYENIKSRSKIIIGVKDDQPGLGYQDATTGEFSGFDIEIALWVASALGYGLENVEFKPVASSAREQAIINGDIDYYVGTYSITDKRKELIGFAGPYLITGQGLLVLRSNNDISGPDDLAGKKVCSATGSTPIQNIRENYPDAQVVEFDKYSQCVDALKDGTVDAVTTDEAILAGYASEDPDNLKVVGEVFTEEKYGIGLNKDDSALREFINNLLEENADIWQAVYDATLGKSGAEIAQPSVERY